MTIVMIRSELSFPRITFLPELLITKHVKPGNIHSLKKFTEHFLHATHMLKKGTIQNKHVP